MWSVSIPPSVAVKRRVEAVPGILPREEGDCHARGQPVTEALGSVDGPVVSTLIRKVSGLRRYRPGRFVREAAMTKRGTLGWDAALHIPACVRSRHGALWQAAFRVAANGAADANLQ